MKWVRQGEWTELNHIQFKWISQTFFLPINSFRLIYQATSSTGLTNSEKSVFISVWCIVFPSLRKVFGLIFGIGDQSFDKWYACVCGTKSRRNTKTFMCAIKIMFDYVHSVFPIMGFGRHLSNYSSNHVSTISDNEKEHTHTHTKAHKKDNICWWICAR